MLKTIARKCLPASTRRWLRSVHQQRTFARGLRQLARLGANEDVSAGLLQDLVYGWANSGWSAWPEMLEHALRFARTIDGPILECGSGLSTVLLGAVAQQKQGRVWSLEHHAAWAEHTRAALAQHAITSVELCVAPLRDYSPGDFAWYDVPLEKLPKDIALVLCDGPPSDTKGGRVGLLSVLRPRLRSGCLILLDDLHRLEEQQILTQWSQELGVAAQILGDEKPIGLLQVP